MATFRSETRLLTRLANQGYSCDVLGLIPVFTILLQTAERGAPLSITSPDRLVWRSKDAFLWVNHVLERPDGSVVVAEPGEPAVKLLSPTGVTIRTVGRKGAGPGEYQTPIRLSHWSNGRTLVADQGLRRLLILDSTLSAAQVLSLPASLSGGFGYLRGTDPEGRILVQNQAWAPDPRALTKGVYVARWSPTSNRVDTVSALLPPAYRTSRSGKKQQQQGVPFAPRDEWAVGPDGAIAILRIVDQKLEWHVASRPVIVGPRLPGPSVRVTDQDKKDNEPNGPPFQLEYPTTKPPFVAEGVLVGSGPEAWIELERPRGAARTYLVVDRRGEPIRTVSVGPRRWIAAIGRSLVYVIWKDDDDETWVEAYRR